MADDTRLSPQWLSPEQLARVMTAAGAASVTVPSIEADVSAGAPTNSDGTLNLVHYAAWLIKELDHGR
jgi:hypothetical protein